MVTRPWSVFITNRPFVAKLSSMSAKAWSRHTRITETDSSTKPDRSGLFRESIIHFGICMNVANVLFMQLEKAEVRAL